jgi:hypothetical protein
MKIKKTLSVDNKFKTHHQYESSYHQSRVNKQTCVRRPPKATVSVQDHTWSEVLFSFSAIAAVSVVAFACKEASMQRFFELAIAKAFSMLILADLCSLIAALLLSTWT